jgi:hypothetical protein
MGPEACGFSSDRRRKIPSVDCRPFSRAVTVNLAIMGNRGLEGRRIPINDAIIPTELTPRLAGTLSTNPNNLDFLRTR